jgi:hypothetical protein
MGHRDREISGIDKLFAIRERLSQPIDVMIDPIEQRAIMFGDFMDHGLPLIGLKEQRRDLIVALLGRKGPISKEAISEIAAIQQAIAAIEAVILDLDTEMGFHSPEDLQDVHSRH